jgi:nickel transport protein
MAVTKRFIIFAIAAIGAAGLGPSCALAHDLQARVSLHPDAIIVDAWFTDDTPAQEAKVSIVDTRGNEILAGKTDDKGVCRLRTLGAGKYKAIIDLIGHREIIEFEVADTSSALEFTNWRLNKSLGLAIGITALLSATCAFWLIRRRKRV